jgi:streptomycin 6-kinase
LAVRQRFYAAIDAGGLDEDRARDWVIVRQMLNVLWTLEDAAATIPFRRTGSPQHRDRQAIQD